MEFYSAIKGEITPLAGRWMELEVTMLSKISQNQNEKCIFSLICRI